ncbi:MAG: integration host factor subunit alpha [Micavibrio sp.]|nr:integration host factor subunit alpha [Micavibrio sp.]
MTLPPETKTMTRADLAEAVYAQVGLSRNESSDLVEQVLDEMMAALSEGDNVKISSFGSFSVKQKAERVGRNPKTGVEVPISPRKVLVFRASHVLKDKINKATQAAETSEPSSNPPFGSNDDLF